MVLGRLLFSILAVSSVSVPAAWAFEVDAALDFDKSLQQSTQEALSELGFDVGVADGDFGPRSQRAFSAFWEKYGTGPDAVVSDESLDLLRTAVSSYVDTPWETQAAQVDFFARGRQIFSWDAREHVETCSDGSCRVSNNILAVGDLTADGRDEIVVASFLMDDDWNYTGEAAPILVLTPDETGRLSVLPVQAGEAGLRRQHPRDAVIADFNGDGVNDLFIITHGYDAEPYPGEQNVLLLSGEDGHTDMSDTHLPQRDDFAHGGDGADLDGDGDIDLLVITNFGAGQHEPYVLWNDGAGQFEPAPLETILDPGLANFLARGQEHRSKYADVRIADIDGDGHLDLLLLGSGDDAGRAASFPGMKYSRIVFGDGSGQWGVDNALELPADRWGYMTFATDAEVIDFDGDGNKDLVLTLGYNNPNMDAGASWRGLYVQLLKGDGRRFTDVTPGLMPPQGYPDQDNLTFGRRTRVADLNGDGALDLVSQTATPWQLDDGVKQAVIVAIGQPDGGFAWADPSAWEPEGYTGREAVLADLDGDGDQDLVAFSLLGEMLPDDFATYGLRLTQYANTSM